MKNISVTFLLHPNRFENLDEIHNAYKDYEFIDDIVVVTGTNVELKKYHKKFRFIQIPGPYTYGAWPHVGLLSRYTWALCCKNDYVFFQDDDILHNKKTMQELIGLNQPAAGTYPRWYENGKYYTPTPYTKYKKIRLLPNRGKAPMVVTGGVLVRKNLIPPVIALAQQFWKDEYNNVFNGEDIFLSRAISHITKIKEFDYIADTPKNLSNFDVQLDQKINKKGSRTDIAKDIYNFFEKVSK